MQTNDWEPTKVNIVKCDQNKVLVYKSTHSDQDYIVGTHKCTCTCSVGITGFPSREPCKRQHAVANIYTLNSPILIPCFNVKGRYLHAVIALGEERAGSQTFYANQQDGIAVEDSVSMSADNTTIELQTFGGNSDSDDSATDNFRLLTL